jgi:hypothetical protein
MDNIPGGGAVWAGNPNGSGLETLTGYLDINAGSVRSFPKILQIAKADNGKSGIQNFDDGFKNAEKYLELHYPDLLKKLGQ